MTEQEIKERLSRYLALQLETENQITRLEKMRSNMVLPPIRSGDGAQHTGSSGDRMGRAIDDFLEKKDRLSVRISENLRELEKTRAMVEGLHDPMEREVLRIRYMDGDYCKLISWRKVALALYGNDSKKHVDAALRLHDKAIETIIFAINEVK